MSQMRYQFCVYMCRSVAEPIKSLGILSRCVSPYAIPFLGLYSKGDEGEGNITFGCYLYVDMGVLILFNRIYYASPTNDEGPFQS